VNCHFATAARGLPAKGGVPRAGCHGVAVLLRLSLTCWDYATVVGSIAPEQVACRPALGSQTTRMSDKTQDSVSNINQRVRDFCEARDWDKFHSPKNLSMALSVEVAEITEHFQWLSGEESTSLPGEKLKQVETELADTFIYLIRLADKLDVDLLAAAGRKIEANERVYPVEKARGNAKKYTELEK